MVSVPCSYNTLPPRLPKLSLFPNKPLHFHLPKRHYFSTNAISINNTSPSSEPNNNNNNSQQSQFRTLFPGGFKRPEIQVPTLVLRVSAEQVLTDETCNAAVSAAVSKWVGIVVLESEGDESGGRLYEAACALKAVVGDRAYLLIAERVDIATAVGASGVVLSDQGLPAIVARNMMMKSKLDTVYLPLVARTVQSESTAVSATSCEGADFLIMNSVTENCVRVQGNSVTQDIKVPIFFAATESLGEDLPLKVVSKFFQSGASGMVISLDDLKLLGDDALKKIFPTTHVKNRIPQDGYQNSTRLEVGDVKNMSAEEKGIAGFTNLDVKEIQLIEEERLLLNEAVVVIQKAAPMMKEVALLVDAASRLNDPFLMVIVGEFNSGKSTVVNALLGRKYLKEGVVPTTNEITLLCYSETEFNGQQHCQRYPDGQYVCYLSAPILKNMNLVDTPGTNVILQRQQRLTEEFVPRADLILFIMSSDRPLTESEVAFLLYVQQWKKKVVCVLNKLDLYQNTSEIEEATTFVKENTRKLLNIEDIRLYPISARSALEAKLSASSYSGRHYEELLLKDHRWITSRFYELENFLFSFLDGSTDTGMERIRLKLETPIAIAERMLNSCEKYVKKEYANASHDLISIKEEVGGVEMYAMKMERESISWRKHTVSLIEIARDRAVNLIESNLQLSNIDLISTYAFRGEKSGSSSSASILQNEIISPALTDAQRLLGEYSLWLQSNIAHEGNLYTERFDKQWHELVDLKDTVQLDIHGFVGKGEEFSRQAIDDFSANAAVRLFEQEIREVALGTFGGLGAAGLSASLLTSVLPTTIEDLLALAFCSAGGLFAISKFPGRRKKAIAKVRKVADGFAREIEEAMQKDLMQATQKLNFFVEAISKPYQGAAQQRIDKLLESQIELANIQQKLQHLKVQIQNLHVS